MVLTVLTMLIALTAIIYTVDSVNSNGFKRLT